MPIDARETLAANLRWIKDESVLDSQQKIAEVGPYANWRRK